MLTPAQTYALKNAVNLLVEHFDNGQVFVSWLVPRGPDGTDTDSQTEGWGNWHARVGQVQEWLVENDETIRQRVRKEET